LEKQQESNDSNKNDKEIGEEKEMEKKQKNNDSFDILNRVIGKYRI